MDIGELLFSFRGRTGRLPFLILTMSGWALAFGLVRINPRLLLAYGHLSQSAFLGLALVMIWVSLAISVKRLHDVGLSGFNLIWIGLLELIGDPLATHSPFLMGAAAVSISAQLWLCAEPGTKGPNRFGKPHSS